MKKLRITVNGVSYDVEVEVLEDDEEAGSAYGYGLSSVIPQVMPAGGATMPSPAPARPISPPSAAGDDKRVLTSPIAGVIAEVKTQAGATVKENEPVVVIEAMKMKTNISSPVSGKVKEVMVKEGDAVQQGQVLVTFE